MAKRRRNVGSWGDVISAFFEGTIEPNRSNNVFMEWHEGANGVAVPTVLYSYGHHFPLAVRLRDGQTVMNADRRSVTTSKHQRACFTHATCQMAFSALSSALRMGGRVDTGALRNGLQIIDMAAERWDTIPDKWVYQPYRMATHESWDGKSTYEAREHTQKARIIGRADYDKLSGTVPDDFFAPYQERRPSAILMQYDGTQYLSSMDGVGRRAQYFICELPEHVKTVTEAFDALKPFEVRGLGVDAYTRQGEWFFVDLQLDEPTARRTYRDMTRTFDLPRGANDGNIHSATRGGHVMDIAFPDGYSSPVDFSARTLIVSGQVRHPEHKTAHLSTSKAPRIFAAFMGRAVRSWSAGGRVD